LHGMPFDAVKSVGGVLSVMELEDGSWEIAVLLVYTEILVRAIRRVFPTCLVDRGYVPFRPLQEEIDRYGDGANVLAQRRFAQRVMVLQQASLGDIRTMTAALFYLSLQLYGIHSVHREAGIQLEHRRRVVINFP
jgi:hypothetical protein